MLTKSADTLIEQITTDRDLQRWLTDFVQERIDEGKKWDVRDGILTLGGELFKEKNKDCLLYTSVPDRRADALPQHLRVDPVLVDRVEVREEHVAPEIELVERLGVEFRIDLIEFGDEPHAVARMQA